MILLLYSFLAMVPRFSGQYNNNQQRPEIKLVQELFRLRNEHKADSAEHYFADTVQVYMKYLRNISRKKITQADKIFWQAHPKNKFEITGPLHISDNRGITTVTITGKEYLNGTNKSQLHFSLMI